MRKTSEKISSMNNLINLFKDFIDEDDIVSAQILSKLSSKIVKYRLDNNMNQKQFATFLGVSKAMISKIESKDYNFTIRKLVELCNKMNLYLDVDIRNEQQKAPHKYFIMNMKKNEEVIESNKNIEKGFSNFEKNSSNKWYSC